MNKARRAGRRQPPEFDIDNAAPSYLVRFLQAAAWDGALPFVSAAILFFAKATLPLQAGIYVMILAAIFIALIRTYLGFNWLIREFGHPAPQGRQLLLAGAILVLLFFDFILGLVVLEPRQGAQPTDWRPLVFFYFAYLACILTALRPLRRSPTHSEG